VLKIGLNFNHGEAVRFLPAVAKIIADADQDVKAALSALAKP
jgi:hypothetical protein